MASFQVRVLKTSRQSGAYIYPGEQRRTQVADKPVRLGAKRVRTVMNSSQKRRAASLAERNARPGTHCPRGLRWCASPGAAILRTDEAVSSALEHCFHTAGVTGSIPVPPTDAMNKLYADDSAADCIVRKLVRIVAAQGSN
jgi:hypothetical protein